MYSAYKLNKQGNNIQLWYTPFPILNQFMIPWLVLTVASQEAGKVLWYSHLFKNFPQFVLIHTVKGFSVVHEAEVDVFVEFPCFFYDPMDVAIWSLVLLPFLNPAWTSWSSRFMYCWSLAWRILSITLLAWEILQLCSSMNIIWLCRSLGLEWKLILSCPVATAEFSKLVGILSGTC